MRITTQGNYGLVCMLRIAGETGARPVSVRRISDSERLPRQYVEKLLWRLRRAGLAASVRGPAGGYVLARPSERITVKEVLDALEHDTFRVDCKSGGRVCSKVETCRVEPIWAELKAQIDGLLGSLTLGMLLEEDHNVRRGQPSGCERLVSSQCEGRQVLSIDSRASATGETEQKGAAAGCRKSPGAGKRPQSVRRIGVLHGKNGGG